MSLGVLHIAYPFAPVGARACGGAEQVLTDVDRALVRAGHSSTVVACEGSASAGRLFAAPVPLGRLDAQGAQHSAAHAVFQRAIDRALVTLCVDLVHMHGLDWHTRRIPAHVPTLVTLHMPIDWYPASIWQQRRPNLHFQCVSEQQKLGCPDREAAVIANGVELTPYDSAARSGATGTDYALALGRICPEKNLHAALQAGTAAGLPVQVGGQTFPYSAHLAYEQQHFRPALIGSGTGERPQHSFLGPLDPVRKQRMLAGARCLLHPTLAPETSSLVAMEALAAGTPVIAYRSGALPEVVDDGETGFLVDDVAGMANAIRRIHTIDRNRCRAAAEARFNRDRMTDSYLQLYRTILHAHQPRNAMAA